MEAQKIVMKCLEKKRMSQTEVANVMGCDRRNLNQSLHRNKDMKVSKFCEILNAAGFEIKIVDKLSGEEIVM